MELTAFLEWMALVLGFYMAWNIGANDVANAMGTSVGSKALTLSKAVFLAAVLEFSGAFFAGSNVSETIQKGIVDTSLFQDPNIFVLGMLAALLSTGIILQISSYFALPVSTTHAIVGSIVGFAIFVGGAEAVLWKEILAISLSWVLSPVLSGIISFLLFFLIRKFILDSSDPLKILSLVVPLLSLFFTGVLTFIFLPNWLETFNIYLPVAALTAYSILVGSIAYYISFISLKKVAVFAGAASINSISVNSVEKVFVFFQIASACMVAFGHGANDVSNAIGPVSAILTTLKTQSVDSQSVVPSWLLAFGGLGIVIGLASWGWRVIETVGKKITHLTPSRGFAAEFGTAFTVLLASKFGLPISTTHALVGAVMGVGLVSGMRSLNFTVFKSIVVSWVTTLPLCASFTAVIFFFLKSIFL